MRVTMTMTVPTAVFYGPGTLKRADSQVGTIIPATQRKKWPESDASVGPTSQSPVWCGEGQGCWGHYGTGLAQAARRAAPAGTQTAQPAALGTHRSWRGRKRHY